MTTDEILSIIYNFYDYCCGKNIENFETHIFYFNRKTTKRLIPVANQIRDLITSNHFTKKDFLFFMYVSCLQKGKQGAFNINPSTIKRIVKRFSVEQTRADHDFINKIMEDTGTKLDDFVKVKEDGQCLLYELFKKNYITFCLPIKYSRKLLTNSEQNSILSIDYKLFLKTLKNLIKFIKGDSHE